tara:strand:+ start:155 stop:388 length:234 start_codon:yes stop_codon:yes gene_type:complete
MNTISFITTIIEWCLMIIFISLGCTFITIKCSIDERQQRINELIEDKYKNSEKKMNQNNYRSRNNLNKHDDYIVVDI